MGSNKELTYEARFRTHNARRWPRAVYIAPTPSDPDPTGSGGREIPGVGRQVPRLSLFESPRWRGDSDCSPLALTAAHLAKDIKTGDASAKITIGKKEYRVEKVVPHPDYKNAKSGADLALVKLTEAVTEIQPVPIYRGT